MPMPHPLLQVQDIAVRFGEVTALDGVSLTVGPGECIGLVGHNGAGKSTLIAVVNGGLSPQRGTVQGQSGFDVAHARALGIRCVFQELSLCPNLTIVENARIAHQDLPGWGWRKVAHRIVGDSLDSIFPGHGIDLSAQVGDLSIAQRQMVEIAMAFSSAATPPRLVILDEPTSSLDAGLAAQLLTHVKRFIAGGGAVILVSHILDEILSTATRIVVMKDARIVDQRPAAEFTQAGLVQAMGSAAKDLAARRTAVAGVQVLSLALPHGLPFHAAKGEIVGLAGLGGHGQTRMLLALHERHAPQWWPVATPAVTFVAGDRRLNGTFDLWSILKNMTAAALPDLAQRGLIRTTAETAQAQAWKDRIAIRTPDLQNPILSLSGGNQQKVLFARALATRAPVVLMDDPMRGVDIGTKQEVYRIIRDEADCGRTFVWYSTEMEEMGLCDRVYVFRDGAIVAELIGDQISEAAILAASFKGAA
jgi:ribose transport system ATP-binding protein